MPDFATIIGGLTDALTLTNLLYIICGVAVGQIVGAIPGMTLLMALPFMHGAAQWSTFHMITSGGKIVLPEDVKSFDADAVLRTVVREGCVSLPVVGDAMV
ncbi:MAG: hypothetical protein ABGW90_04700, partial [Martelella sp.]